MADPPKDEADWFSRLDQPDAKRLREALAPYAPCFALAGDGPRFLQDLEAFEQAAKPSDIKPVDMLFIDSAGDSTASKNADLMVKRDRFDDSLACRGRNGALHAPGVRSIRWSGQPDFHARRRADDDARPALLDEEGGRFPLWRLVFANVLNPERPSRGGGCGKPRCPGFVRRGHRRKARS